MIKIVTCLMLKNSFDVHFCKCCIELSWFTNDHKHYSVMNTNKSNGMSELFYKSKLALRFVCFWVCCNCCI